MQGGVQRVALRGREGAHHVVVDAGQQISERGVGEARMRLARGAPEHLGVASVCGLHSRAHEGRLADAAVALEHQGRGPVLQRVEEVVDGGQLGGASYDIG